MMKQFRRNRYGVRASDRETQDKIRREMDSCSRAPAGWADARASFATLMAAGSIVIAAIGSRVIERTVGLNRDAVMRIR